jgi:NAD(P)H-dependent FMN reductase
MARNQMDKLNIVIIEGTSRVQRKSINAAKLVYKIANEYQEIEAIFVDPNDFDLPGDGNDPEGKDPKYTEITKKADGFFIITPEYNHSFPGSLKRLLDSELENYIHKPVAFAGVSSGMIGGARAIEALVGSVREMGMIATFKDVHFPRIKDIFDDEGKLLDEDYIERVKKSLDELVWMAKALKYVRENISSKYHEN